MPDVDIEQQYRTRLDERRALLAREDRGHARIGNLRLAIAASAAAILFFGGLAALSWLLVPLALFVLVAFLHARLLNTRDRTSSAIGFYERGLARIGHEWIGKGRDGDQFRQTDHLYADDLDVFGRGSLFELLATMRTRAGEETLARWLLSSAGTDTSRSRQQAVSELSTRLDLREAVAVLGDQVRIAVDAPILRSWAAASPQLGGIGPRLGVAAITAVTVTTIVLWARDGSFGTLAAVMAIGQGLLAWVLHARVAAVIHAVDEASHDLDVLGGLLRLIERQTFDSPHLQQLRQVIGGDDAPASREIARLSQLVALLASRRNVLFALPAGLVMWATQWAFAIDAWKRRAGVHIPQWLDAVGEFETLLALGGFAAEHPSYIYPDLIEHGPGITATDLAHPALPATAVANDIAIGAGSIQLLIVSGSNMSGKSTWMRTIGASVVLARMGAPVRARTCRMSPLSIGAAIRVQDSLTDGRSRFFAEIRRLKQIVDLARAEKGAVLFLLDEILSGTNSHDRRIGAEAVLTSLVATGAIGLVTTHDLALGAMGDRWPDRAANAHFEDQFVEGELRFDYRLKPGIVKTSNALALMRSIGLDV